MEIIKTENLTKVFNKGKKNEFTALKGVNITINEGEFVSIMGSSGSGKSTLLNLLSLLDRPTEGKIFLEGSDVSKLDEKNEAVLRRRKLGFVFQQFNLIPSLTAIENIELPMRFNDIPKNERTKRAKELLKRVNLSEKENNKVTEMSGGEMQRVAIARSLANNPKLILADEPTGNLDSVNGANIMKILKELNENEGKTLVVVTHDINSAEMAGRIIRLRDGLIF